MVSLTPLDLHDETNADKICIYILLGFNIFWFIPTLYYASFKFFQHRTYICIRARHPRTTCVVTIGFIIYIIAKSFKLILGSRIFYNIYLHWIYLFLYPISAQIMIYASLLRFWLLFFDVSHSKAILNLGWKVE